MSSGTLLNMSFNFVKQATSTSHEPATATIVISINDTNDNGPTFQRSHYTGFVLENSLIGTTVMQASAQDPDAVNVYPKYIISFFNLNSTFSST